MKDAIEILFVEDDFVDQTLVKRALKRSSEAFVLHLAESVSDARDLLLKQSFDCALVDLYLPDGNGTDLVSHMSGTPMIVLTGLSDEGLARQALSQGVQDYLFKDTLDSQNLQRAILYSMERRKLDLIRVKLQETNRLAELGLLAASIAHEINNPNSFVLGNLTFMRDNLASFDKFSTQLKEFSKTLDPQAQAALANLLKDNPIHHTVQEMGELVSESLEGIARVSDIVRQMQMYSRINSGEEPVERISLNDVANWACTLTQTKIKQKAQLTRNLDPYLPFISAKQGKLAQIAANLLNNAIQAISEKSLSHEVSIATSKDDEYVYLVVEDTGCGVPSEVRARIFEPFFSTKSMGEGTGLGLTISIELAKEHGGELMIEDREVGGTRATLRLPLVTPFERQSNPINDVSSQGHAIQEDSSARVQTARFDALPKSKPTIPRFADEPKTNPTPPPLIVKDFIQKRKSKVLIIDDEPAIRRAQARLLRAYDVTECGPVEALSLLNESADFDVVLCDMLMPEFDGVDIYNHVEHHASHLQDRIIFMTGGVFTERGEKFLEYKKVRTLFKPVNSDVLRKEMLQIIENTSRKNSQLTEVSS